MVVHYTLSFSGFSLLYTSAFQYFSVTGKETFFHTPWGFLLMLVIPILYPIPALVLYVLTLNYEALKANVKEEVPEIYEFFMAASCSGNLVNPKSILYLSVAVAEMTIIYGIGTVFIIKIFKKLTAMNTSFSPATLKLQKQFLRSFSIQYSMPFFALLFPVSFLMISIILGKGNIEGL